jgi:predicted nucleic acid-binding protein
LDNSTNSRLLWPDSTKPANNACALESHSTSRQRGDLSCTDNLALRISSSRRHINKEKIITQAVAQGYFNQLASLPIMTESLSHANNVGAHYALSLQYGLSLYDSAYLELALRLGAYLATNDGGLIDSPG